jgi:S1-C subfamily serine protease
MLPFPEGLMDVLQRGGYFPQQPQRPDTKPAPVQAKVSAPQSPAPSSSAAPSVARPDDGVTDIGTAFFVSKNTLLTNAHVVEGCTQVTTAFHGIEHKGTVIAKDASNDLALIRTDMSSDDVAHLRDGARLGEDVSVFGFPLSGLLASSGNFTRGSITAAAGLRDDTRYFQISAPVQPGNSGGPLLDRYGNVVGIVVAKLNALTVATLTDDIAQNVNFAIKASIAESFLRANDVQFLADTVHEKLTPEDIAAKAQSFSVEVECRPAN